MCVSTCVSLITQTCCLLVITKLQPEHRTGKRTAKIAKRKVYLQIHISQGIKISLSFHVQQNLYLPL